MTKASQNAFWGHYASFRHSAIPQDDYSGKGIRESGIGESGNQDSSWCRWTSPSLAIPPKSERQCINVSWYVNPDSWLLFPASCFLHLDSCLLIPDSWFLSLDYWFLLHETGRTKQDARFGMHESGYMKQNSCIGRERVIDILRRDRATRHGWGVGFFCGAVYIHIPI